MRSITAAFILASIAVAGCSSKTDDATSPASAADATGGTPPLAAVSGTRLHAKFLTGGGAHELVGFHDSARNEDCTFQKAEDGHTRCLPGIAGTGFPGQTGAFSDAACTIPVAATSTCAADTKYGITYRQDTGNCGGQVVNELRKVLPATAPRYITGQAGCILQTTAPPPQVAPTVALGEVVPWTSFVDATETTVPGTPVSERVLVASDGARQHLGFRDDKIGASCTFQLMTDGVTRCVPEAATGPVMYSDAACTTPFLVNGYTGGTTCGTTSSTTQNLWLEPSPEACGGLKNVYSVQDYTGPGSAGQVDQIFQFSYDYQGGTGPRMPPTATCNSAGNLGSGGTYDNRRVIAGTVTSTLPRLARVSNGSGRLVPALVWPAGTDTTLIPGWHDTERDVDCTFTLASDGKTRCLPTAAAATLLFTDDACKSPSMVAVLNQPSCIVAHRYASVVSTTCPPTTTVYALGTIEHTLPSGSVTTSPGHCGKVAGASSALDATVVDPTQFMEGVPSVE